MSLFILDAEITRGELLAALEDAFPMEVREGPMEQVTYRDTFDWRFFGAGLTLTTSRIGRRARVVATDGSGTVIEATAPKVPRYPKDLPNGPLREMVEQVGEHRRLLPRAEAAWAETLVSVLNEDGKTVVRLLFKEGEAQIREEERHLGVGDSDGLRLLPRLHTFPLKGYKAEEQEVVSFLRKRCGLKREKTGEVERVYEAVEANPGDYSPSLRLKLKPETTSVEAAKLIHLTLLSKIRMNEEGLARDWDAEFLHDLRVSVRRTRSALTELKGVFPDHKVNHFLKEFRWLWGRTGPTRDIDVYLLNIPAFRGALPRGTQEDLEPFVRLLKEKKRTEHRKLRRSLRSKRYTRLMKEWRKFLESPKPQKPVPPNSERPILALASERIWKAFNKVIKTGENVGRTGTAKELHRLRLHCKKLRYLITFFRSLYPGDALNPIVRELKGLQDNLGDFNDCQVQRQALGGFADELMVSGKGPPATLLAMGQLMGQLEGAQIREKEAFRATFKQFARPKNRKRFGELFGPSPKANPTPMGGKGAK